MRAAVSKVCSTALIRNAWYQAAWAHEVGDTPLARTLLNEPVVLFRDPDAHAHALYDISEVTFEEDVEILGAQQTNLSASEAGLVDIKSDERRQISRRTVERLLAEEAASAGAATA